MANKKYRIIFSKEVIAIEKIGGEEVLYWCKEEWESDPEIVFSICNAVKMAAEGNDDLLKFRG